MIESIRRTSARAGALAALALLAPALQAQTIDSPYRFVETSQAIGVYAGNAWTGRGTLELGPASGAIFGARYNLRVTGPFTAEADVMYLSTTRSVLDTIPADPALRVVGEADMQVLAATVGVRFNITGPRTWNGLQPYVALGGGLAFDLAEDAPAEETLPEDVQFDLGTRFMATAGGGIDAYIGSRLSARIDARSLLWKLTTPRPFLIGEPGLYRPPDEWTQNFLLTASIAFRL